MVTVVVLPVVVNVLGVLLTVHAPAGKLLSTTVPVATVQVGWVMVPTTGFNGVSGCALITILAVGNEIQPSAFVTVNVYVPAVRPLMVTDAVLPVVITEPGFRVSIHEPDGKPFSSTEPVASEQVGCMILYAGVAGVVFGALVPLPDILVHPLTVVVTVNVPAVFTVMEAVAEPLLHKRSPDASVDRVEVPSQLSTTVTTGVASVVPGVAVPVPCKLVQPPTVLVTV